jgi:DNA-binding beta-propeller fold protein YncE
MSSGVGTSGVWRRPWIGRPGQAARVSLPSRPRRGARLRFGLTLCALIAASLACCGQALALSQRGHSFAFSFGATGSEGGEFESPSSVAVSESTGDVYVSDSENNRIEQFSPETGAEGKISGYKFVSAWGWGVANGEKVYQRCLIATECKAGIKGGKFFDSPGQLAVDNSKVASDPSKGDVYVIANHHEEKGLVYKFGPDGEPVSTSDKVNRSGELVSPGGTPLAEGEAPMALGTVEEEVFKCSKSFIECEEAKVKCKEELEKLGTESCKWQWKRVEEGTVELGEELEIMDGVAVDANGLVWLDGEDDEFRSYSANGQLLEYEPEPEVSELDAGKENREVVLRPGLAVQSVVPLGAHGAASQDHLYFDYELHGEHAEGKKTATLCQRQEPCLTGEMDAFEVEEDEEAGIPEEFEGRVLNSELTGVASSGVALDPVNGDAYVDNAESIATLDPNGSLVQRFGSSESGFEGLEDAGAVAVDHAASAEVGAVYALEPGADEVAVFESSPAGAPAVDSIATPTVESEAAVVSAEVDPDGAKTTYVARYSAPVCTGPASSCAGEAPLPAGVVEGFGDHAVSIDLSGLAPSTTYDVEVLAESSNGKAQSATRTFTTRASTIESALLDDRAWEQVSPVNKHGAEIEPIRREGGLIQASPTGGAVAYIAVGGPVGEGEPEGDRSPEPVEVVARRSGTDWKSENMSTPNEAPAEGFRPGGPWEYQFFSAGLSEALVAPISHVSLAPAEIAERAQDEPRVLYVRDDDAETCPPAPKTCYLPIVSAADYTSTATNEKGAPISFESADLNFETATPDMKHIVISSTIPLTSELAAGRGLYMWSADKLQLISKGPNELPQTGKVLSAGGSLEVEEMKTTAISEDGARVVWTGETLYMRELEHEGEPVDKTYEIAEPNTGVTPEGERPEIRFQTANATGSKVFFTDDQNLTTTAGREEPKHQNLYVFEPEKPAGQRVTDLTPRPNNGEPAGVQGDILGTSSDGTVVYFVADAALSAGAERGDCLKQAVYGAECNLYVARYTEGGWQAPQLIARLSADDSPDWGWFEGGYELGRQTSRVSPNGEYLAFMSSRSLTGYDNEDVNSEKEGERVDEEVYLYDHAESRLVCASCNPSGARPQGMFDQDNRAEPEGEGPLIDRPESWQTGEVSTEEVTPDPWLAANIPGWTKIANQGSFHQSSYLSNEGRLFFNSADALVPVKVPTKQETVAGKKTKVGVANVYEYEPKGVGSCVSENTEDGCVALISSGETEQESAFVEASETGNDVFFVTDAKLVSQDADTAYDLYDARVCTAADPCPTESSGPPSHACTGEAEDQCRAGTASGLPLTMAPASSTPGSGNIAAKAGTLAAKAVQKPTPKPLTRAQKLAKALKQCKKDAKKRVRAACERTAREKYGPKKAKKQSGGKRS